MKNIYNQEEEIQDKVASAYDSVYGSLIAYEDRWGKICEQIKEKSQVDDKILEIGCGTATLLKHLKDLGFSELNGCDLSTEAIKEAKTKIPNAHFKVANMIDMPYKNDKFNIIIFNGSLHHLPFEDIVIAIEESYRILKKDGFMIIADANDEFDCFKPLLITKIFRKTNIFKKYFKNEKVMEI